MQIRRRNVLGGMAAFAVGRAVGQRGGGSPDAAEPSDRDLVVGPGAWCWFQQPRAAIDRSGSLWLGSTQGSGAPSPGSVDITRIDLDAWRVAERRSLGRDRVDDHTAPSVLPVDGGVQVGWAPHRRTDRIDLGPADGPLTAVHRPGALRGPGRGTAYVSAHVVGRRRWVLYRGERFSWNLLTSSDGRRWRPEGLVVAPDPVGQRPYLLGASDGERLHLVVSDGNPTERLGCGTAAATVEADLTITDGAGRAIGRVGSAPASTHAMARLLEGRPAAGEDADRDAWIADIQVPAGRPAAILTERMPWPGDRPATGRWHHRLHRAERDASGRWRVELLGEGGRELYRNQPDYCGLAALDPTDADHVVLASDVHPGTGEPAISAADGRSHHELWSGARRPDGVWRWTAVTAHSIEDNLRPVIVSWAGRPIVAWMRGTYRSWTDFDTQLVVRAL